MNKSKRWFRPIVAGITVMSLLLTACSAESAPSASSEKERSKETSDNSSEASELVIAIPISQPEPKDMELVQEEVNKLTSNKINATVKLELIPFSNWQQQMNLMMSSGEKLDVVVTMGSSGYATQAATGKLAPLDDLLAQYGQGIADHLDRQYLNAAKVKGSIYGVPVIKAFANSFSYFLRKDLVDKHNIDVASIQSFADIEHVLQIIKDKEPGITPLVPGGSGNLGVLMGYNYNYDGLSDGIGVLTDIDTLQVSNWYDSQQYKDLVGMLRKWYQAGYILSDAATNQISSVQLVKAGKAFSYFSNSRPGFVTQETINSGTEMIEVELTPPVSTTANVTMFLWSIANQSQQKEKAMQFLNLLYSDQELVNLLDWGIEGKHYQKIADNVIDFAPGIDAATSGYLPSWSWLIGNSFLSYVMKGDDPDIWDKLKAFNSSATKSKALGFNFNPAPVKNEYTAIANVLEQYTAALETGTLDPEKILPELNGKLQISGIDKVVAEKQRQLEEWAELNQIQ